MPKDPQHWLEMRDFSPGIRHRAGYGQIPTSLQLSQPVTGNEQSIYTPYNTDSSKAFAASMVGTTDCFALPGGGLGPLPKRTADIDIPITSGESWQAVWAALRGPIGYVPFANTMPGYVHLDLTHDPVEIYFALTRNTGSGTAQWRLIRGRLAIYGVDLTVANAAQTLVTSTLSDGNAGGPNPVAAPTYFMLGRASPGSPTNPGLPFITANRSVLDSTTGVVNAVGFPNPAGGGTVMDWTVTPTGWPAGTDWGGMCVYHQARHVFFPRVTWNTDLSTQTDDHEAIKDNSRCFYSSPNDTAFDNSAFLSPELPFGFGAIVSFTASDLLLIGHDGGGLLIQGDLNSFTARRLPGIPSTHGKEVVGAMTPLGYVYGIYNGGVYAVDGGGGANFLSPDMPPNFWIPDQFASPIMNAVDYAGTFAYWGDLIMCPGNWVYHIPSNSWWAIDRTSTNHTYHAWLTSPTGMFMYGIPTTPIPKTATKVTGATRFDQTVPADSWTWAGQPIVISGNRVVRVREIVIVAQGNHAAATNAGTITVTLSNPDGTDPQTQVFALGQSAGYPQRLRAVVEARDLAAVRVTIAAAVGTGIGAPFLHQVLLGYDDAEAVNAG